MVCEYFGLSGLKKLASLMKGDENILIGVRPFGFHAGNVSAALVYPLLLCEELSHLRKIPRLNITFYMNDYEQHEVIGHPSDPEEDDEANIYPKGKTLQYEKSQMDNTRTMVDFWSPIIIAHMNLIKESYPDVRIRYRRTSDLRKTPLFRDILELSLERPEAVASVFEEVCGKPVRLPAEFARVVCPRCETPVPETKLENGIIKASCECGHEIHDDFYKHNYWFNHNLLGLAKLTREDNFFLWMLGYDHKQFYSREIKASLIDKFGLAAQDCNRVYAPLLLREDGSKMSKSSHNIAYARIGDLLEKLRRTDDLNFVMPNPQLYQTMQEITLGYYKPK